MSADIPTPNDAVSQRAAFWFQMVKFIGWPGVILMAMAFAGWQCIKWSAPKVDSIVTTHISVLNGLLEQQKVQGENQRQSNEILGEIKENQKTYATSLQKHGELLEEIHNVVSPRRPKTGASE